MGASDSEDEADTGEEMQRIEATADAINNGRSLPSTAPQQAATEVCVEECFLWMSYTATQIVVVHIYTGHCPLHPRAQGLLCSTAMTWCFELLNEVSNLHAPNGLQLFLAGNQSSLDAAFAIPQNTT